MKSTKKVATNLTKLYAIAVSGCAGAALVTVISINGVSMYEAGSHYFFWENASRVLIFLTLLFAFLLIDRQGYAYWPFWGKATRKHADERQMNVRRRVFERAYARNILLVIALLWLSQGASHTMQLTLTWIGGIFIVCLPAVLAAWEKDS